MDAMMMCTGNVVVTCGLLLYSRIRRFVKLASRTTTTTGVCKGDGEGKNVFADVREKSKMARKAHEKCTDFPHRQLFKSA